MLDDIDEFKGIITSTEFLAKDIYERICLRLKNDYLDDYHQLHKIKITLTSEIFTRLSLSRIIFGLVYSVSI